MKFSSSGHIYNSERGASTFQMIALVAVVLMLMTAAYTTVKNRSGVIDGANNAWMDNQVQLWRENASPPAPYGGMNYRWDVPDPTPYPLPVNHGGGGSGGGAAGGGGAGGGTGEEPPEEEPPEEEECETGFWGGVSAGFWDMIDGIKELGKLLWEILADFDAAKEKLGPMAEQLKELAEALGSLVINTLNPWGDRDKALADLIEVLETLFPDIADALKRGCTGEAIGRLTFEVATIAVSFTKATKLLKFLDNLSPAQLLNFFENLAPDKLLKMLDDMTPDERKALQDKLNTAGAPCKLLGAFGNSFSADTLVMTPDGLVAISTIEIGDLVLAYHEATGEVDAYPVTDTMRHLDPQIVLLTIEGELIKTTPEHPFYVMESAPPAQSWIEGWQAKGQAMGHWVVAEELDIGDDIRSLDGSTGDVTSIEIVSVDQWMYNLTVDVAHTFFVGDGEWLVHNACLRDRLLNTTLPAWTSRFPWQAHHVVPKQLRDHPVVQQAIANGWDLDGASNGIPLPSTAAGGQAVGSAVHSGSHRNYTAFVQAQLNQLAQQNLPPAQLPAALDNLINNTLKPHINSLPPGVRLD